MSTIFRVQKTENYVVLDKGFLNNDKLSWKAKGLLAYMLSMPNDWKFNINDLAKRSTDGKDAVNSIIKELSKVGYIIKQQKRGENGKFGSTELLVFETPQTDKPQTENPSTDEPQTENPSTDKPQTETPSTDEPQTENPSLLSNNLLLNNNSLLSNKITNYDDDKQVPQTEQKPNPELQNAFVFYEQNGFGTLSAYLTEKIDAWINDLSEELVIESMKLSVENNARSWKYVETILRNWSNKGFKTLGDVQADHLRFEAQKNTNYPRRPISQQPQFEKPKYEEVGESHANGHEQPVNKNGRIRLFK